MSNGRASRAVTPVAPAARWAEKVSFLGEKPTLGSGFVLRGQKVPEPRSGRMRSIFEPEVDTWLARNPSNSQRNSSDISDMSSSYELLPWVRLSWHALHLPFVWSKKLQSNIALENLERRSCSSVFRRTGTIFKKSSTQTILIVMAL
jgi:hypothetical protein